MIGQRRPAIRKYHKNVHLERLLVGFLVRELGKKTIGTWSGKKKNLLGENGTIPRNDNFSNKVNWFLSCTVGPNMNDKSISCIS